MLVSMSLRESTRLGCLASSRFKLTRFPCEVEVHSGRMPVFHKSVQKHVESPLRWTVDSVSKQFNAVCTNIVHLGELPSAKLSGNKVGMSSYKHGYLNDKRTLGCLTKPRFPETSRRWRVSPASGNSMHLDSRIFERV